MTELIPLGALLFRSCRCMTESMFVLCRNMIEYKLVYSDISDILYDTNDIVLAINTIAFSE